MKIVVNVCYGGFGLSNAAKKVIPNYDELDDEEVRTSPDLINFIEKFGGKAASDSYAKLVVEEIPDNATDWTITEYDGAEDIIYVVDGKIRFA